MEPIAHTVEIEGAQTAFWEWPATCDDSGPPLFFAHATGFHARVFDGVIEHFPGRQIFSMDLHGHGRSEGGPVENWAIVIAKAAGLIEHLGLSGAIGIGHSMGAHILAQCASDKPDAFSQLVLFDPVIMEPEFYSPAGAALMGSGPHPSIRRKRDFDSAEAMMERFRERDPYNIFAPKVFEDYCRFGLAEKASGEGYELACLPEMEASIYGSSRSNIGIHDAVKRLQTPTLVVRAKRTEFRDFKSSPTWPKLAEEMPHGTDMPRPDRTHFHPFEDPADAAAIIKGAMSQ